VRTLQSRRRAGAGRPRKRKISSRAQALKTAAASGLEALVVSVGDRAAEEAVARWRNHPAGAALLEQAPANERVRAMNRGSAANRGRAPFDDDDSPLADSAVPPPPEPSIWAPLPPAGAGATARQAAGPAPSRAGAPPKPAAKKPRAGAAPPAPNGDTPGPAGSAPSDGPAAPDGQPPDLPGATMLGRSSPDLPRRAARAISSWQDHVMHLVQAENVTKRSIARVVSFDDESLALVVMIALLGFGAGDAGAAHGTGAVAQELLSSLFGPGPLREIGTKARADLGERVRLLFDEEMLRFAELVDAEGAPDETAAVQLYQATYSLEVVR
jgi:hypothetical protein